MLNRSSRWCAAFLLLTGLTVPAVLLHSSNPNTASADEAAADELEELKDQLRFGLLVQRPEDREYIDRVVLMVEQDELPLDLVKSTFQWARRKKKPYPFQYFQRALKIRAAQIGVRIE